MFFNVVKIGGSIDEEIVLWVINLLMLVNFMMFNLLFLFL